MAELEQERKWRVSDEKTRGKLPPWIQLVRTLRGHTDAIGSIVWSPNGQILASTSLDGATQLWDAKSGNRLQYLKEDKEQNVCVALNARGSALAGGSEDGTIRLWNVASGELLHTMGGHYTDRVRSIVFDPKRRVMATGNFDGTLEMWEATGSRLLRSMHEHRGAIASMAYNAAGRLLATGGEDNKVRIWKASSGKLLHVLDGHEAPVTSVTFDPHGRFLATGSADRTIKLWNPETCRLLRTLEGHTTTVRAVTFSPDGRCLASGGNGDDLLRFWNPETGKCIASSQELNWERSPMPGLTFHPRLPILASVGSDPEAPVWLRNCVIHLYELDLDALLAQTSASNSITYTSAKVVLVGDSGVGKTGLGWRLAHGEFKEHASTHGQQFWLLDQLRATGSDGTQRETVLWDLAGQSDYRLIHALFLGDTDVALVLFDPTRHDDPLSGVEFWLKQLKVSGAASAIPTILVAARTDRGAPRLTEEELKAYCHQRGIKAYVPTSAKENLGGQELVARIQNSIPWETKPQTVTTETFKHIKDHVLQLKESPTRSQVVMAPEELRTSLEATDAKWPFTEAEMLTAIGHLANHGYVTMLKTSLGQPRLLLAPELLNNLAASFVLEARRNPKGLGALEEELLLARRYSFPELEKLTDAEKDILLDSATALFLERHVCFRETDPLHGRAYLVFPELINLKHPLEDDGKPVQDGVAYTVAGSVENVYASLVVLMGYTPIFTRTGQWNHHARYEVLNKRVCGFRLEAERAGELDFVLFFGPDVAASVRILFQGFFENFLGRRHLTVRRYEPVACPDGHVLNRVVVRDRIASGGGFAFCPECGKKISIPRSDQPMQLTATQTAEVEAGRRVVDERSRFERVLFRLKSYAADANLAAPTSFVSYAWGNAEHEQWVEKSLAADLQKAGIHVILDRWANTQVGSSIARFVSRAAGSDFIIAVGTSLYQKKIENGDPARGYVVAAEGDLIGKRMLGTEAQKMTVLPVLLEGTEETAFPDLLQGRLYADFRQADSYFEAILNLLLSLYHIGPGHPVAIELKALQETK